MALQDPRPPLAFLATLGLVGCSSSSRSTPDASVEGPGPVSTQSLAPIAIIGRAPVLGDRLRAAAALVRAEAGFRVQRSSWASVPFATLPARAPSSTRLEAPGSGVWLEVVPSDLADVGAREDGHALVFADVRADTDLVWLSGHGSAEELRVLRGPKAPTTARWTLHRGPAIAGIRLRDGRVEALDAEGRVRIATEAPFAIDASGTRRALTFTLEDASSVAPTLSATLDAAGLAYPIVVDPTWLALGAVPANYYDGTAVLLPSGKVGLFGTGQKPVALYDSATRTFSVGASLLVNHDQNHAILLGNNKVLVVGAQATPNAELWTEAAGGIATGPASTGRVDTLPVQVNAGGPTEAVYFFGGRANNGSTALSTAEKYIVSTGLFAPIASMPAPRHGPSTALLADGKILIAGGLNLDSGLLYDPVADTYESLVSLMPQKQFAMRSLTLSSGKVLFAGGETASYTQTAKTVLYDPTTKLFSAGPTMKYERDDFGVAKLSGNRFLAFGGRGKVVGGTTADSLSTLEIYDEASNLFALAAPSMPATRERMLFAALGGDRVLSAGGVNGLYLTTADLYSPDPVTCTTTGPGCAYCVDGYCCDRACGGQCEACDLAGSLGFCDYVVGAKVHGTRPACTPTILCGAGGSCLTTCSADAACGGGKYCSGGACFTQKATGVACAGANECTSGFCVDGVCCGTACTGQCQACDKAGSLGTCANVTGPTHGARAACTGGFGCDGTGTCATTCATSAVCGSGYRCDAASSTCVLKLDLGTACLSNGDCTSGNCVDGYCCNSACNTVGCQACDLAGKLGTCTAVTSGAPHGARTCAPFGLCGATGCVTSCTDDAQCGSGYFCVGGTCVAKKNPGEGCGGNGECKSGFCAGGVCCDKACTAECESCALSGALGTCKPRPSTDSCGLSGCVGATLVARGTCSGVDGACTLGALTPCPDGLKCADKVKCKTACATDADCASGVCDTASGKCTVATPDAGPDAGSDATDAGSDTGAPDSAPDGASDTAPSDGGPDAPTDTWTLADGAAPILPPKPVIGEFQRCTKGSECATGHCVDGVCCDTACQESCHTCALLASPGKCVVEPVGVDLRNECGAANTCVGTCGGAGECVGSGKGTMCGRNRCTSSSTGVGPAYCAGPGAPCPTDDATPFDCTPYACEPAFGACQTNCKTSADCANGFSCDTATRACVPNQPPPAEAGSGGCSTTRGPSGGTAGGVAMLGLALLGLRRSRRMQPR